MCIDVTLVFCALRLSCSINSDGREGMASSIHCDSGEVVGCSMVGRVCLCSSTVMVEMVWLVQ